MYFPTTGGGEVMPTAVLPPVFDTTEKIGQFILNIKAKKPKIGSTKIKFGMMY